MPVTCAPSTRVARQSAAAPVPEPTSSTMSPSPAGTAAASKTASIEVRNPNTGCCRRTLPPSRRSSVRYSGIAFARSLGQHMSGPVEIGFVDHDPALHGGKRAAVDAAGMGIENDRLDTEFAEAHLQPRDEYGVAAAGQFDHLRILACFRPRPNGGGAERRRA